MVKPVRLSNLSSHKRGRNTNSFSAVSQIQVHIHTNKHPVPRVYGGAADQLDTSPPAEDGSLGSSAKLKLATGPGSPQVGEAEAQRRGGAVPKPSPPQRWDRPRMVVTDGSQLS